MRPVALARHPLRALAVVVALLAGLAALAACRPGAGDRTAAEASGGPATVTGLVVRSPACPVARADRPCASSPVAGAHVSLWRHGRQVAVTQTDEEGRFRLSGPAGAGEIRAVTPLGGYVARTTRPVVLHPGTPTSVRMTLDSGIR